MKFDLGKLLARRDRAGLEAAAEAAARHLAALDMLEGHTTSEQAAPAPLSGAERARRYRERHAARNGAVTETVTPSVTEAPATRHGAVTVERDGGDKGGVSDQDLPEEKSPNNPEKITPCAREASRQPSRERDADASRRAAFEGAFDGTADAFLRGSGRTTMRHTERADLAGLVSRHAPTEGDRVTWLEALVRDYCAQTDANFWRRTPAKLAEWLETGRPSKAPAKPSSRPRLVQRDHKPALGDGSLFFDPDTLEASHG